MRTHENRPNIEQILYVVDVFRHAAVTAVTAVSSTPCNSCSCIRAMATASQRTLFPPRRVVAGFNNRPALRTDYMRHTYLCAPVVSPNRVEFDVIALHWSVHYCPWMSSSRAIRMYSANILLRALECRLQHSPEGACYTAPGHETQSEALDLIITVLFA